MQVAKYLENKQPIIYRTFVRSLQNKHLSHAYLISGNPGTPLLEVAKYLAKSILCDSPDPLACNNCITCLRIDDNNYPDFIVLDGSKKNIKKEEVGNIETQFEKTAFEAKGKMIYILHLVENMSVEAINSILKFLEEPGSEIYAFLTTNNENNVLPTIISRCQLLRLKLVDRKEVINEAISLNVPVDDAELLSYFYNNGELIYDVLNDKEEKENYDDAKNAFVEFLKALNDEDNKKAIFYSQKSIIPLVKTKESARFFLDMLVEAFEDLLNIQHDKSPILKSYDTILQELARKLSHIDESLIEILKDRNLINLNVNISLLMDHLVLHIIKEN
ncbi:MAG: hypothetical protein IJK27_04240 [Bacilli bacterium]|nr:hypothetical protein [Bacilli bacterium]